jgi:hypothetical protein
MHSLRQYFRSSAGIQCGTNLIVILGEKNEDDLLTSLMGEMEQDRELDSAMSRTHKRKNYLLSGSHTIYGSTSQLPTSVTIVKPSLFASSCPAVI